MKKDTSWGNVADWYDTHLKTDEDSFQRKVILPNILRLMNLDASHTVLDLACGNGFFSGQFATTGATVIGIDIAEELIALAIATYPKISFFTAPATDLAQIEDASISKITCILAIQNIENVKKVFQECARVLKPDGTMYLVINHPAFRIPQATSWGWDEQHHTQYRRVDAYLSEKKVSINMEPGKKSREVAEKTISFHRPLQYYCKLLNNSGFAIIKLEEWISHKQSQKGVRQKEEDRIRKEIPLFLAIEARLL